MAPSLDLGNLIVHLRADSAQYNSTMSGAVSTMKRVSAKLTKYTKRMALAISAQMTLSVKAFASFETQLANVSTMLDDHTMKYMPAYSKALKTMAVEFGEGTVTLSKGLYDILSATIAPAKALDVLAVSAKAAKAGMTTTAIAADAITSVLNSYGLAADEAGRVSDILFATVKRGKLTFAELAPNIGKVAAMASLAGLSFEELSAAISTMTRAGLKADLASTAIRALMTAFIKPTDGAKEAAAELGLVLSSTTLRTIGLAGVMKKLKGVTAEQVAALIPNIRATAGFAAALRQAGEMAFDLDMMLNATGMTQVAYEKMTATLAHTMRRLWQAVKIVSVEVGARLAPSLDELAKRLISNQAVITDWAIAFTDRIVFVKEILWAFVANFKGNWLVSLKYVFDVSIIMFKAFAMQMKVIGAVAADAFTMAFADSIAKSYAEFASTSFWEKLKSPLASAMSMMLAPVAEVVLNHAEKMKTGAIDMKKAMEDIANITKLRMGSLTGPDLKGDFGAAFENLARKDLFRRFNAGVRELKENLAPILDIFSNIKDKVSETLDSFFDINKEVRLLEDTTQQVVEASMTLADAYRAIRGEMGRMTREVYEMQLGIIDGLKKEYEAAGVGVATLIAWEKEQIEVLTIEYLKMTDSIANGFKAAGMQIKREIKSWGEIAFEFSMTLENSIARGLENSMRDFDNWKDHLLNVFEEVYWAAIRIALIQPMAQGLAGGITAGMGSLFSGGAGMATVGTVTPQAGATMAKYADGGIAWSPQVATLAENEPELIAPLSQLKKIMGGSNQPIQVHLHNEGTNQTITKAEAYFMSDQRILDVWTKDAITMGRGTNRVVRQIAGK